MKQLFILIVCISFSCSSLAQTKWDFHVDATPIPQALQELSRLTGIPIGFSSRLFPKKRTISLSLRQASVEMLLSKVLEETEVGFTQKGKGYILKKKTPPFFTLSGFVADATSGEQLIQASIYIPDLGIGVLSNEYGFFSLKIPEGNYTVQISYSGFTSRSFPISFTANRRLSVKLQPNLSLEEVLITSDKKATSHKGFQQIGRYTVDKLALSLAPNLLGENDLVQQVRMLPGVQSGADGFGGLHVRGGDHSQNLIILDGVPIYNPSHILGLFSIFNSQAIRMAQLHAGGFSPKFGGRISSILDVHTREGNQQEWNSELSLGLLSGNALVEGPVVKDRGAILLSTRNLLFPYLLEEPLNKLYPGNGSSEGFEVGFYDLNGKVNYTLSQADRIYLSYYRGRDWLNQEFSEDLENEWLFEEDRRLNWGNEIVSFRWNHIFHPKLFSNFTLSRSSYRFKRVDFYHIENPLEEIEEEEELEELFFQDIASEIHDIAASLDFALYPNERNRIQFGGGINRHKILPEFITLSTGDEELEDIPNLNIDELITLESDSALTAIEGNIYGNYTVKPSSALSLNLGARISFFQQDEELFFFPEPRFQIGYLFHKNWQLQAGVNRMVQYMHQVGTDLGMPSDVWIPSGPGLAPQRAWQQEAGIQFQNPDWRFRVSFYAKQMDFLYSFTDLQVNLNLGEDLEEVVDQGQGDSKGIEFFLEKIRGKNRGFLSYSLSKSERLFSQLNLGKAFPYQYDNRHRLGLSWIYLLNPNLRFSLTWNFASGAPHIVVVDQESTQELTVIDPYPAGSKNSFRNRPQHHIDIGLNFIKETGKVLHTFKVGVYNAYNRDNTTFHLIAPLGVFPDDIQPVSLIPIMPSFRYGISF